MIDYKDFVDKHRFCSCKQSVPHGTIIRLNDSALGKSDVMEVQQCTKCLGVC